MECRAESSNSDPKLSFLGNVISGAEFGNSNAVDIGESGVETINETFASKRGPRCLKVFEQIEETGTNISYRCMKCRNYLDFKNGR